MEIEGRELDEDTEAEDASKNAVAKKLKSNHYAIFSGKKFADVWCELDFVKFMQNTDTEKLV